jgi:glycosyltransferase involved in cell wall biosynthesis
VAPLPPQVGGVAAVAEWLVDHEGEIGCRYDAFDLHRPPGAEAGGRLRAAALPRQLALLARFVRWIPRSPRVVHYCVSCSVTGLARDLSFVLLLRLARRAVVAHVHGSEFARATGGGFQRRALRVVARATAERVAVAPWAERALAEAGVPAVCIFNPIRLADTEPAPAADAAGALRLLQVGVYGTRKGSDDLIEALARAREAGVDANLTFVGKEMYRGEHDALAERVRALGLDRQVRFVPPVAAERLASFYRLADVICLPSLQEVLPMSLLEGMAFGLPALATPVGGIPDIVVDGVTGRLVQPRSPDELAAAIRELASDAQRRRALGAAARERVLALAGGARIAAEWRALYGRVAAATASEGRPARGAAGAATRAPGIRP